MAYVWNNPPGWPTPPPGWIPPSGWKPQPEWPTPSQSWQYYVDPANPDAPRIHPSWLLNDVWDSQHDVWSAPNDETPPIVITTVPETVEKPTYDGATGVQLISRIFSFRILFSAGFIGFICALLVGFFWDSAVVVVFFITATLAWVSMVFASNPAPLVCPYCRKRVKLGAEACHHCGRILTKQEAA